MIKCLVVDDEPLGRECIINYINQVDFLTCVGSCTNALEINTVLDQEDVDLLFLDIQMPIMNGLEFLKMTSKTPMTILTTAYPNYALDGFDLDVLDYLLKPITFNRFFTAVTKAKKQHQLTENSNTQKLTKEEEDCFFIKCDGKYEKIYLNDILFVKAMQNYVIIQTNRRKYVSLLFLKNVEEKLNSTDFIRVHKSYIVALSKIDTIENHEIQIKTFKIPVSRNYKKTVFPKILGNKLWSGGTNTI
ncbi:DNA-binding response regulator [Aquimarina sp. AD10]|uniref:LytR/AlgR family response regulator transcription factor n=1 Tax=Aquimarina sp. AD10 TaxID=1714849 RepID=UPI000E46A2A1|nr:LytTR family DNA-binding domain-containing protein [Aquimarina sp. AD10]AXT59655.1 DNA-binding response regulator [Aquimarina sp. AD10]RKM97531.1 response regulator [Aquimarina sp. AD10]